MAAAASYNSVLTSILRLCDPLWPGGHTTILPCGFCVYLNLQAPDRSKCGPYAAVVDGAVKFHIALDGGDPRITFGPPWHIEVISKVLMGRSWCS